MIDITIVGSVTNSDKNQVVVKIYTSEIEELIKKKAIEAGVKGYEGRAWTHYDEGINQVIIND